MKYKMRNIETGTIGIFSEDSRQLLHKDKWITEEEIPETVVDEDYLAGHPYPGHETWEDYN